MAKMTRIYLDTAAATPLDGRVKRAMLPYLDSRFGNPSSLHAEGVAAARWVQTARQQAAAVLGVQPDEIIFTSGGTESNNLALTAAAGGEIVISAIEHASIKVACPMAVLVPVDARGVIDLKKFKASLTSQTKLVSVIYANNEIGTIQPLAEIAKIIRAHRKIHQTAFPYLHTDACQATRFLELFIPRLGVDLLTLNAAKIYGPKGVGLLYVKRGVKLLPLQQGGGQEDGRRAGTENVAGIVGLATALELAASERRTQSQKLSTLRNYFIAELQKIPGLKINGTGPEQLPHLVNVTVPNLLAEQLVIELDARGIALSTGSACAIASHDESYVIMALGRSKKEAEQSVRFSFDRHTTKMELKYVLKMIKEVIKKYQTII
jgi:cysteine desulfurase